MQNYLELMTAVLVHGHSKPSRAGATKSLFGERLHFDLRKGFPIVTTRKISFDIVNKELKWMMLGRTDTGWLNNQGVHIWDSWANEGQLGPIYGQQWRHWRQGESEGEIDQLKQAVDTLRTNPNSRRIIVSGWNVGDLQAMALPPCHALFQFYSRQLNNAEVQSLVREARYDPPVPLRALSCQVYQRSADLPVGVPYNIAFYALLTHLVANCTNHLAESLTWVGGDCHIYEDQVDKVREQLMRTPLLLPTIACVRTSPPPQYPWEFKLTDIYLKGYQYHSSIDYPVAVGDLRR